MKVLVLINTNKSHINSLEDCETKSELFVYMIKSYIQNFKDIELFIENCLPYTEMKSTFKSKNINFIVYLVRFIMAIKAITPR